MFFNQSHKTTIYGSNDVPEINHDSLDTAIHECMLELSDVNAAIPQAMVACYEAYHMDNSKSQDEKIAMLESTGDGIFEKIKNFFKKVWEKLAGWWNSVVKFLRSMFMSDKEFIKKYKKELEEKSTDKFEYEGFYFKPSVLDGLEGKVTEITKAVKADFDIKLKLAKDPKSESTIASGEATKIDKAKKDIEKIADTNAGNFGGTASAKNNLKKAFRGDTNSKKPIKGLAAASAGEMIKVLEAGESDLKDLEDLRSTVNEAVKAYDDEVDKFKSEFEKAERAATNKSKIITFVNSAVTLAKHGLSYQTGFLATAKECKVEMHKEYSSVLRSFLRYSPKKENFGITTESASILDEFTTYV